MLENLRLVYVPDKKDVIDKAIAFFINIQRKPHAYVPLFKRISTGVYQYNTKRIFVKIDRQGKLKVREDGNYQPLE